MTNATPADRAMQAAGMPTSGKEVSRLEEMQNERIAVVRRMLPAFKDALRDELTAKRLLRDSITAIRTVPDLVNCTQESFLGALMIAAQLDLRPNVGALGHGWVLPYKNRKRGITEAQWILGYRGMITLAARSGLSTQARTIYHNERWLIKQGLDERLEHTPIIEPEQRGNPIIHYAIARSSTGRVWAWLSHAETLRTRDRSQGYIHGSPDNPWRKDEENGWPMCRKTVVRRLFSYEATDSPELALAMTSDERVAKFDEASGETSVDDEPTKYTMDVTRADAPETVEHKSGESKRRPRAARKAKDGPPADATGEDGPSPEDIEQMRREAAEQAAEAERAKQEPLG